MHQSLHQQALDTFPARLRESERFHMGVGKVQETMIALADRLRTLGVDYAIIGGMALNAHGYARETVDVDVLIRDEGLRRFGDELVGRGYRPAFEGARKTFRDTSTDVQVEFIVAGDYPGDGKPKPVAFPDPAGVSVEAGGIRVVDLRTLVELKLASGMTQPARRRDLADVQDLIRVLKLDASFAGGLNEYVRPMFMTLMEEVGQEGIERQ